MRITVDIRPIAGVEKPHISVVIDATPDDMKKLDKIIKEEGFQKDSTPLSLLAQACFVGKHGILT